VTTILADVQVEFSLCLPWRVFCCSFLCTIPSICPASGRYVQQEDLIVLSSVAAPPLHVSPHHIATRPHGAVKCCCSSDSGTACMPQPYSSECSCFSITVLTELVQCRLSSLLFLYTMDHDISVRRFHSIK